jgi:hypothetical protein
MAGYSVGPPGGGDLSDLTRRAREAAPAMDELRRKEEQRQAVEERGTTVEERSSATRGDVADATARLSSALQHNTSILEAETVAINASTAALLRNAEARRAVTTAATGGRVEAVAAAGAGASAPVASRAAQEAELRAAARAVIQQEVAASSVVLPTPRRSLAFEELAGQRSLAGDAGRRLSQQYQAVAALHQRAGLNVSGPTAGSAEGYAAEREATAATRDHVAVLEELRQKQSQANQAVNEAAAAYANSANALSRHGALTTEFIQAFARGEVTLKEFESQMLSTMGKFGGWAIAGGLVYGVADAFKHLVSGAAEANNAVQQLGRFIPGLGGPAGGGSGQQANAIATVRDISTQFNEPMSDVVNAMQVMARTFHNVADAGDATRAVLAAVKLDQVPQGQAEQYLIGISQSLGLNKGSDLVGVVNSLNALQAQYGARVQQTLPGLARAAPAAVAGGLDLPGLEALTGLGVRAGLTGNQVGTAITRSITNFAFTQGAPTFQRYGIQATPGDYGGLIRQVMNEIDTREKAGTLRGQDLTNLARALGGPQLSRVFLPLLGQEAISPGAFGRYTRTTQSSRTYQEDLNSVLATTGERFKAIGIALENFGARLAAIGAFTPVTAGLDVITKTIHAIEVLTNPLVHLASSINDVVNLVPGLKEAIAAFLVFRGARALYNSSFGANVEGFIGRLPPFQALQNQPRQAVQSTISRLRNSVLPLAEREQSNASSRWLQSAVDQQMVAGRFDRYAQANPDATLENDPQLKALHDELTNAERNLTRAAQRAADAQAYTAQVQEDINTLSDSDRSLQERINYLKERQLVALTETAATTQAGAVRSLVGGGAAEAAVGGGAGGAAAAAAGAAAIAGAAALARSGSAARDIGQVASDAIQSNPSQLAFFGGQGGEAAPEARPLPLAVEQQALFGSLREAPTVSPANDIQRSAMQNVALAATNLRSTVSDLGKNAATGASGLWARATEGGAAGIAGRLTSQPALLAATFATQIGGGLVGGRAGQYIQDVGGQAATGAFLGSMLGGEGPYGALVGGTLGTIAGSFQQGGVRQGAFSLAGTGAGAGLGLAAALLAPESFGLSIPLAMGIGALFGGQAGSLLGAATGGGQQSPQDMAHQANLEAANMVARAERGLGGPLNVQVASDLQTAFTGTGSSAQQAQQRLQAMVQRLTAEQQLYGANTPQGQAANTVIGQVIAGAARGSTYDPSQALQLMQTADQARQQVLQNQLQYRISTAPAGQALAQGAYIGQRYQQNYQQTWGAGIADQQSVVNTLQATYDRLQAQADAGTLTKSGEAQLKVVRSQLKDAQSGLSALTAAASQAKQNATLQQQAAVQAGYQADIQTSGAQGQLAQAQAGGSQLGQLQAQLATQQRNLGITAAARRAGLDPTTAARDTLQAQAQIAQLHTQMTQYGLTQVQAQGQLAVSQVPLGDPVGQAQAQLHTLEQQYEYMRSHKSAFDPTQITQVLAQINDARKQAVDAAVQYGTQMNDLRTQIDQAQAFGDSLAQAQAAVSGASRDVSIANRGGTPQERAQARLNQVNAANQLQQAAFERVGQVAQTQSAQEWGDPLAQANTMIQAAQRELATARGFDEQNQALQNLAQAQQQQHQALMSNIQAEGQLQQTLNTGDTVAQAGAAMTTAQALLANAHGQQEVLQGEQAVAAAQVQMRQALEQRYQAQGQLAASLTNNPLQQIQDQIAGLVRSLSVTQGQDARTQVQTQINQLKLQYQNEFVSQRESTVQFQLDMYQITTQQAINQLQDLLKLKNLNVQQRQQIAQQIRQLQFSDTQSGQFDLAPSSGNVNLPTVYDVHRLMRNPGIRHTSLLGTDQSTTNINVDVKNAGDVPAVADAIERTTGAKLKGRLRAAGLRGI